MDRFEDLRAFVKVVESGSLTRAAEAMNVATSAVSRRIKDLEGRLGTQLLHRTTRQMRLTAPGETFHTRAVEILSALEEAEAEAGDQTRTLSGPLRIAAPLSFGMSHLGPLLLEFSRAHPELELDIDLTDRFVDLVAEGYDLAVRIGNLSDSSYIARKLATIRHAVVASPAFWERYGVPESPADLSKLPAIGYTGGAQTDTWAYTAPNGKRSQVSLNVAIRSNNGEFMRDAALAGMGVALEPSFIVCREVDQGTLVPVLLDHEWPTATINVVYPETRHMAARARAFIDFLREKIDPNPPWESFLD